jgi:hypothetical protein
MASPPRRPENPDKGAASDAPPSPLGLFKTLLGGLLNVTPAEVKEVEDRERDERKGA